MGVSLECSRPVADDSLDSLYPLGTLLDNSTNSRFNTKLYALFSNRPLKILDLGCAGGGFVEECIRDGHVAVGLEGSDLSQRSRREAWGRIPENLFTCDVTAPFELRYDSTRERILFDVITAWELLEHIPTEKLPALFGNVRRHLTPDGFFIASTSRTPSIHDGHDLHVTRKGKAWWVTTLGVAGLHHRVEYVRYFASQFVRGTFELVNWFHLVCTDRVQAPPRIQWSERRSDILYQPRAFARFLKRW